jgi:mxaA protein
VVHAATLPRLLEEAPQLQPLAERLQDFFRASGARFFGAEAAAPFPLRELGRALRDAERRHQR